jgi:small subunit ribosomal protein S2
MVIPGNDDAIRSIRLITKIIADSCARGLESSKGYSPKADSESPVIQTIKKDEPVIEKVISEELKTEEVTKDEPVVEEVVLKEPLEEVAKVKVAEETPEEQVANKDEK